MKELARASLSLNKELLKRAKIQAIEEGLSLNAFCIKLIEKRLQELKDKSFIAHKKS